MSLTRYFSLVSALSLTGALLIAPAWSQTRQQMLQRGQRAPVTTSRWGSPKDNPNNGNTVALRKPETMANLPDFTGHWTFVYGTVRDFELGQAWTQFFHVEEPPDQVMQWYQSVFQGGSWQITAKSNTGNQIAAKNRDGNTCQVTVVANKNPKSRSALTIAYFIPKKQR